MISARTNARCAKRNGRRGVFTGGVSISDGAGEARVGKIGATAGLGVFFDFCQNHVPCIVQFRFLAGYSNNTFLIYE